MNKSTMIHRLSSVFILVIGLLAHPAVTTAQQERPDTGGNNIPLTFIKVSRPVIEGSPSLTSAEYWTSGCVSANCRKSGFIHAETVLRDAQGSKLSISSIKAFQKLEVKAVLCGEAMCSRINEIQLAN